MLFQEALLPWRFAQLISVADNPGACLQQVPTSGSSFRTASGPLTRESGGVGTYVGACRRRRRSFGGEFCKCLISGERNMACGVHSRTR
jgi:hypothetical protein